MFSRFCGSNQVGLVEVGLNLGVNREKDIGIRLMFDVE